MSVPSISYRIAQQLLMEKKKKQQIMWVHQGIFAVILDKSAGQLGSSIRRRIPLPQQVGENTVLGHVHVKPREPEKVTVHPLLTFIQHIRCQSHTSRDRLRSGSLLLVLLPTLVFLTTSVKSSSLVICPTLIGLVYTLAQRQPFKRASASHQATDTSEGGEVSMSFLN